MRFSLTALAIASTFALASGASATTIFTDSFEDPANTLDWQVYDMGFADWDVVDTDNTTGIEIQTTGTVSGVSAHDGDQYVELDSDPTMGGGSGGTNSAMTRALNLAAGQYRLDWYYLPRTSTENDNVINVYLDVAGDAIGTNLIGTENETRPPVDEWMKISYIFNVDGGENPYALTFEAGGIENKLGGFIDSVTLTAVPVPAGILLMGTALAGFGVASRRRKAA